MFGGAILELEEGKEGKENTGDNHWRQNGLFFACRARLAGSMSSHEGTHHFCGRITAAGRNQVMTKCNGNGNGNGHCPLCYSLILLHFTVHFQRNWNYRSRQTVGAHYTVCHCCCCCSGMAANLLAASPSSSSNGYSFGRQINSTNTVEGLLKFIGTINGGGGGGGGGGAVNPRGGRCCLAFREKKKGKANYDKSVCGARHYQTGIVFLPN